MENIKLTGTETFSEQLNKYAGKANRLIFDFFPSGNSKVLQAARYSLSIGGKRLRPALVLCVGDMLGCSDPFIDTIAASMEFIHTYSLIHDDLPCMDDDDLRRGKPSCHIVFGEGMATLAGDCLLNCAFETLLDNAKTLKHVEAAGYIAACAGHKGMIGGQCSDIEGNPATLKELEELAKNKTSGLLKASLVSSAIVSGASKDEIEGFSRFGDLFGLAFQLRDDILDELGNTSDFGKKTGSDKKQGKVTFLTMLGAEKSLKMLEETTFKAQAELKKFSNNVFLCSLLNFNLTRES